MKLSMLHHDLLTKLVISSVNLKKGDIVNLPDGLESVTLAFQNCLDSVGRGPCFISCSYPGSIYPITLSFLSILFINFDYKSNT